MPKLTLPQFPLNTANQRPTSLHRPLTLPRMARRSTAAASNSNALEESAGTASSNSSRALHSNQRFLVPHWPWRRYSRKLETVTLFTFQLATTLPEEDGDTFSHGVETLEPLATAWTELQAKFVVPLV